MDSGISVEFIPTNTQNAKAVCNPTPGRRSVETLPTQTQAPNTPDPQRSLGPRGRLRHTNHNRHNNNKTLQTVVLQPAVHDPRGTTHETGPRLRLHSSTICRVHEFGCRIANSKCNDDSSCVFLYNTEPFHGRCSFDASHGTGITMCEKGKQLMRLAIREMLAHIDDDVDVDDDDYSSSSSEPLPLAVLRATTVAAGVSAVPAALSSPDALSSSAATMPSASVSVRGASAAS